MNKFKLGFLGLFGAGLVAPAMAEEFPMTEEFWTLTGDTNAITEYQGQQAMFLKSGFAVLKDQTFKNGTIEFDMAIPNQRGFMGLMFRSQGGGNYENVYFRPHQSGKPDANQYTPSFNGISGWQLYFGPQYSTGMSYKFDTWLHIKVLVKDDTAEFYLDSDEPFLHVADLLQENVAGEIALSSFFTGSYFANFKMTEDDNVSLIGSPVSQDEWPENLVSTWQVATSTVRSETLDKIFWLGEENLAGILWTSLDVEANGVANLARVNGLTEEGNTVFVRLVIDSEKAQVKHLRYGFSDKAKAYVNGKLVAGGDDTYQTRDYRYLGTVGLFDSLYLDLKEGRNEVVFAVTEAFGGWALKAAFEDMEGISIPQ